MTMLYSFYSAEGIVYAADSRITRRGAGGPLPAQRKVLPIPGLGESSGVIGFLDWPRSQAQSPSSFSDR
jgi:hypothetical protein